MIAAIIEARIRSTRLPYKVTRPLAGKPILHWVIKRAQVASLVDRVVVATPRHRDNAEVFAIATEAGAEVVTGPENDVLTRDIVAARASGHDVIVRLTGDNPFVDPQVIDLAIHTFMVEAQYDLVSTCRGEATYPRGVAVEVLRTQTLEALDLDYFDAPTREHVTVPLYTCSRWKHLLLNSPWSSEWREKLRLTVDTYEDYALATILYDKLGPMCRLGEVIAYCEEHPEIMDVNRHIKVKAVRG